MLKTLQGQRTKLNKTKKTAPTVSSRGQTTAVILCSIDYG